MTEFHAKADADKSVPKRDAASAVTAGKGNICHVVFLRRVDGKRLRYRGDSQTLAQVHVDAIADAMAPWRLGNFARKRIKEIARGGAFRGGLVVWADTPIGLDFITPLEYSLEPTELREEDPEIRNIADAASPNFSATVGEIDGVKRSVRRWRLRIGLELSALIFWLFQLFSGWLTGGLRSFQFQCSLAILFLIVGLHVFFGLLREYWRIVQNGVIIETSFGSRGAIRQKFVTRARGTLIIRKRNNGYSAAIWKNVQPDVAETVVTEIECIALIAAWTSPLPPPSRKMLKAMS